MNNKSRSPFVLVLLLSLVLGSLGILQHEDDDLVFDDVDEEIAQQPLIHVSPTNVKVEPTQTRYNKINNYEPQHYQNKIERLWGIPNVTATTGHVFKLQIPKQAFSGNIYHYEVAGGENKPLPKWLFFDEATYTLLGVPCKKDVGQQHHVSVKAYGATNDDVADDVFTIQVIPDKYNHPKHKDEKTSCKDSAKQTLMLIQLDVKFDDVKPSKKVKALENLANHLELHVNALSMYGQNNKENNISADPKVLFTGPGNVKHRRKGKHSTLIQWQVGCDGHLWKHQSELLKVIKQQAKDKTLAKLLQLPVIVWQVKTNGNVKAEKNDKSNKTKKNKRKSKKVVAQEEDEDEKDDSIRNRREAGSGDYGTNNDNDNEDYDDNYDDYDEAYDDNERGDDDNNEAITEIPARFIPSSGNSDPKIIEESESEHPHRHHHGQETEDRKTVENIGEQDIIPVIDRQYDPDVVNERSSTASTTSTRETTLQTTPTTDTPSISSSTTLSPYSTLSTTTTEIETSAIPVTSMETSSITSKTSTMIISPTTEVSVTYSSLSGTQNTELLSGTIEETNRIDDSETSLSPFTTTTLETETVSPTTLLTTTLFNHFMSTSTRGDRLAINMTSTAANNTIDQELESTETTTVQSTESSPVLTTVSSKSAIPTTVTGNNNQFDDIESFTTLPTLIYDVTTTSAVNSTIAESSTPIVTTTTTTSTTTSEVASTLVPQTSITTQSTTAKARQITTERVDYGIRNYPPQQDKSLPKVAVTAGKPLNYIIPEDTFSDIEDGNTRNLHLALYYKGSPLKDNHWLQFNSQTQEVYGLPLENDVSVWNYDLVAMDRRGLNVSDRLDVYVQQNRLSHSVNHEFGIHIKINKHMRFAINVDWQLRILERLAELYDDRDTKQITVRSIELLDNNQAIFTWTNDSVPRSSKCPKHEINKLHHVLATNINGEPTTMLQSSLSPEISVNQVIFKGRSQCDNMNNQPHIPVQPPMLVPPRLTPDEEDTVTQKPKTNNSPMPRNQVDHINATVGQLLVFRVPKDTFYDSEDGPTRDLKLSLLTRDRSPIPPQNWLQFDVKNQEFYGVPMNASRQEYQLIATDGNGASANDNLVVIVKPAPDVKPSAEFTIKLGVNYNSFSGSAALKRNFIQKLRDLFGDKDTNAISITSISRSPDDDNTIITWRNTTLPTEYCPNDEITRLSGVLFVKPDNKELTNRIERVMGNEFPVDQLTLTPMEICLGEFTRVHSHDNGRMPAFDDDEDESTSLGASQDDYLITFVLPAIIISAMLILAGIIACVLYKRKRSGKMSVSGHDDERQTFRNKGIPVIFQDELEEKPDLSNKSLVILKEEKPPLPPPEYLKIDDGSDQPMLPRDSHSEEPYQPPPPFARTSDSARQNRPKPTPTYRKPPPYVPP